MAYEILSNSGSVPPSSCEDVDAFLCALARIAASDPDSLAGEDDAPNAFTFCAHSNNFYHFAS